MSEYEVPLSVQMDLDNICEELNVLTANHKVEVRGFWIWVQNSDETFDEAYEKLGFKWSERRQKWYYAHPDSPQRSRGARRKTAKKKSKSKAQVRVDSKPKRKLTKREELEQQLKSLEESQLIDSGENWINFEKMKADVRLKIKALDLKVMNH